MSQAEKHPRIWMIRDQVVGCLIRSFRPWQCQPLRIQSARFRASWNCYANLSRKIFKFFVFAAKRICLPQFSYHATTRKTLFAVREARSTIWRSSKHQWARKCRRQNWVWTFAVGRKSERALKAEAPIDDSITSSAGFKHVVISTHVYGCKLAWNVDKQCLIVVYRQKKVRGRENERFSIERKEIFGNNTSAVLLPRSYLVIFVSAFKTKH